MPFTWKTTTSTWSISLSQRRHWIFCIDWSRNTLASPSQIFVRLHRRFRLISSPLPSPNMPSSLILLPLGSQNRGTHQSSAIGIRRVLTLNQRSCPLQRVNFHPRSPLVLLPKVENSLSAPARPILPLLSSATGSFTLGTTTMRSKLRLPKTEQPFQYEPDSTGDNCIGRENK